MTVAFSLFLFQIKISQDYYFYYVIGSKFPHARIIVNTINERGSFLSRPVTRHCRWLWSCAHESRADAG